MSIGETPTSDRCCRADVQRHAKTRYQASKPSLAPGSATLQQLEARFLQRVHCASTHSTYRQTREKETLLEGLCFRIVSRG